MFVSTIQSLRWRTKNMTDFHPDESPAEGPASAVQIRPKKRRRSKPKKAPRFHVVLWNDDDHTYDYVILMLRALFGYSTEQGYRLAREVDRTGRAVVFTSSLEKAELKRDQILAFGPDPFMKESTGPLVATLERDRD